MDGPMQGRRSALGSYSAPGSQNMPGQTPLLESSQETPEAHREPE